MSRLNHGDPKPSLVAARIKAERTRLGWSQEVAAKRLGINRSSYKQLEITANPCLTRLIELVRLGYRLDAIAPELQTADPEPLTRP